MVGLDYSTPFFSISNQVGAGDFSAVGIPPQPTRNDFEMCFGGTRSAPRHFSKLSWQLSERGGSGLIPAMNRKRSTGLACVSTMAAVLSLLTLIGCGNIHNLFVEDGPSFDEELDSPTSADVRSRMVMGTAQNRGWSRMTTAPASGAVRHGPLYFEDPFEDKGFGRTRETHPRAVHVIGWEDAIATPYSFARFTANWLLWPASLIVTPPVTLYDSDGEVSPQLLGYDHDAEVVWWVWGKTPRQMDDENRAAEAAESSGEADSDAATQPTAEPIVTPQTQPTP